MTKKSMPDMMRLWPFQTTIYHAGAGGPLGNIGRAASIFKVLKSCDFDGLLLNLHCISSLKQPKITQLLR